MFYFRHGDEEELLLGSADLMPRNLDGRIEILFPVEDPRLQRVIRDEILFTHLRDTKQLRRMDNEGSYCRVVLKSADVPFDSQAWMLEHAGTWHREE